MTRKNIISLAIVVVFGLLLQVGAVALDCNSTPADTAVSFARAYYGLNPSMTEWMCGTSSAGCSKCVCGNESVPCSKAGCDKNSATCPKAASGNESVTCSKANSDKESATCPKTNCGNASAKCVNTAVEEYLYNASADAAERGFSKNFAKYTLSHIETRTEYLDDATALVHLTAHRRVSINPVYAHVALIFGIGDTYKVDDSIRVKLEDGQWRVCKSSLSSLKTS